MATRPAAEIHTAVPPLSAERQVTWPKRTKARLANGLEVVLAESHTIPKFHGELFLRSGCFRCFSSAQGMRMRPNCWEVAEDEAQTVA